MRAMMQPRAVLIQAQKPHPNITSHFRMSVASDLAFAGLGSSRRFVGHLIGRRFVILMSPWRGFGVIDLPFSPALRGRIETTADSPRIHVRWSYRFMRRCPRWLFWGVGLVVLVSLFRDIARTEPRLQMSGLLALVLFVSILILLSLIAQALLHGRARTEREELAKFLELLTGTPRYDWLSG